MKKFLLSLIALVMSVFSANAAWEQTTSIAVGDVVVLAVNHDRVTKELSTVTTSGTTIGQVVDYTTTPAGVYPLTVVAGTEDGTFGFKNADGAYLAWSSDNSLKTSETLNESASWTVTFTETGTADINNVATPARKLQYNANSPRFACYTSSQTAPILFKEVAEGAVTKPVITPGSTTVFAPQEVVITAEEGAEIYYTLNGGEEQKYEAPFTVSETTTVEAYAKVGENKSGTAKVIITFGPVYAGFAAANEAATNDHVVARVNFTDALVTYVNGSNSYVQDATGAMLIYGNSGLTAGDKVTGYVQGQLYLYNGLPEVASPTVEVEVVSSENEVVPTEVDAAELAANPLKYVSQYVVVKPAKFAEDAEVASKVNINFTVGETALVLRNNFVVEFGVEAETEYEVAGLVTIYNSTVQLYPTKEEDIAEYVAPYVPEFAYAKYIVKNVGSGLYWGAANDWGTRASLIVSPEFVKFDPTDMPEGQYKLESQVNNGGTQYYFNGDYMDNGNPAALIITKLENGNYTIALASDGTLYGYDGTSTVLGKGLTDADDPNAQWTILSLDDAKAALANATETEPMNASLLFDDLNFGRNNRYSSKWTIEASNKNLSGGNNTNNCAESYHSNFTLTQTVEAPNGLYAVTAQGFYRQDGTDNDNLPVFFANGETQTFPLKTGTENSMSDASVSFSNGLYTIDPIYVQVTDGQLSIGAKLEGNTSLWCIWDNFQVQYYGADADINAVKFAALIAKVDELIAEANELKADEYAPEATKTALDEAIAAGEAEKATEEEYNTAIETLQAAIDAAKVAIKDNEVVVTGIVPDDALDHWTCTNTNTFHINTWSVEGNPGNDPSGMVTPFIENWVGKPGPLGEGDITYTVPGTLKAGIYEVSALVRVYSESGADVAGAKFFANEENVDLTEVGEKFEYNNMKGLYTTVNLKAIVGEDGALKLGVNIAEPTFNWVAIKNVKFSYYAADDNEAAYKDALAALKDGQTYRVFTEVGENKFYLNASGYLVSEAKKAATFTFNAVQVNGTLYETGWNLGCKFTNPSLTGGATGDVVNNGHINVGGNDRNDWERQVFFLKDGKYAVRATNANSANWGANTYWDVLNVEAELPNADYSLEPAYVWQIEENVDNRPEAFAKVQSWAGKLQDVEGLVQDASMYTSNAKESTEGSYAALLDNTYETFFHSSWSAGADADHYLQAEIEEPVVDLYVYFKKRSQNDNNRPTNIQISGSQDGENFTDITALTEGLPTGATPLDYTSGKLALGEAYKYVRFTVLDTNNGATEANGHKFFTFSEFYLLPSNELTDAAVAYMGVADYTDLEDSDIEPINALDEQIAVLVAQKALVDDLAALDELIAKVQAYVDATDTYTDKAGAAATASEALAALKAGTYTTAEAIAEAIESTKAVARTFFAGITPVKAIDVTEFYLVNPTPMKIDGWEGDAFGTSSDGVCEYWNKSAATFHQAVTLPAGDYKLTVTALQRTDMTGYVYAGENQTTIVGVDSGTANSRAQASNWFAAGNGLNEVLFTMEEAGDIEIGLKADETTGDHWTVWQSFKIELLPVVNENLLELTLDVERYVGQGYGAQQFKVDFADAAEFLGVEAVTTDMLRIVNPDGTEISDYATYDGWFAAETGTATTWSELNAASTPGVCVKFFQAVEGGSYDVCDQWSADVLGAVYTFKWALVNGEKKVVYTINVKMVEKPIVELTFDDLNKVGEQVIDLKSETGKQYEGLTADVNIAEILTTLGVESIDDVTIYAVMNDGSLDDNYKLGTTDGWRNADGDWQSWGDAAYFYVKADFERESAQIYEVGGMEGKNSEPASYTATYVFVKDGSETNDAVVLKVNLTYDFPVGINAVDADLENAVIYDLAGRRVSKAVKGGIYIINGKKVAIK